MENRDAEFSIDENGPRIESDRDIELMFSVRRLTTRARGTAFAKKADYRARSFATRWVQVFIEHGSTLYAHQRACDVLVSEGATTEEIAAANRAYATHRR